LNINELIRSLFSLIFVISTIIIGIKIIKKYDSLKKREFQFLGFSWILMSSPWWWSAINLIISIIFNAQLNNGIYIILSNAFIPIGLILWIYAYAYSMDLTYKRTFTISFFFICMLYECIFIIFLIFYPDLIGYTINLDLIVRTPFSLGFAIFTALTIFFTGILFSLNSIRSKNEEIKIRGYCLLVAFSLITFGSGFDAFSWTSIWIIIVIRSFLILSSIFFYIAFFFPRRLTKRLTINKEI